MFCKALIIFSTANDSRESFYSVEDQINSAPYLSEQSASNWKVLFMKYEAQNLMRKKSSLCPKWSVLNTVQIILAKVRIDARILPY